MWLVCYDIPNHLRLILCSSATDQRFSFSLAHVYTPRIIKCLFVIRITCSNNMKTHVQVVAELLQHGASVDMQE